jgi:hypothetical protein
MHYVRVERHLETSVHESFDFLLCKHTATLSEQAVFTLLHRPATLVLLAPRLLSIFQKRLTLLLSP